MSHCQRVKSRIIAASYSYVLITGLFLYHENDRFSGTNHLSQSLAVLVCCSGRTLINGPRYTSAIGISRGFGFKDENGKFKRTAGNSSLLAPHSAITFLPALISSFFMIELSNDRIFSFNYNEGELCAIISCTKTKLNLIKNKIKLQNIPRFRHKIAEILHSEF